MLEVMCDDYYKIPSHINCYGCVDQEIFKRNCEIRHSIHLKNIVAVREVLVDDLLELLAWPMAINFKYQCKHKYHTINDIFSF